jgi:hypothetical protein
MLGGSTATVKAKKAVEEATAVMAAAAKTMADEAVAVKVAAEATTKAAAEEATVVKVAKEATTKMAADEAMTVKVAAEAVVVAGPDCSDGGGLDAVRSDARGAANTVPDLKAVGKRPATTTGSGGSSPPRKGFCGSRWYCTHLLQFFPFHSSPKFSNPCLYAIGHQTWTRHWRPRAPKVVAPRTRWWMRPMVVVTRLLSMTPQQV